MMKLFKFLSILLLIPSLAFGGASSDFVPANDDRFSMGDVTTFDGADYLAIVVWFYMDANTNGRLVTKWGGGGSSEAAFDYEHVNTTEFRYAVYEGGGVFYRDTTTASASTSVWNHIIGQFTGPSTLVSYLNGGSSLTMSGGAGSSNGGITNTTTSLQVGHETDESADGIDGKMAFAAIYMRTLTETERKEILWKPDIIPADGLWAFWEATTVSVKDLSGNGNNGTAGAVSGGGPDESDLGPPVMFGGGLPL